MQLRAYDLWTSLAGTAPLPSVADLVPAEHPAIAPHGVLLDFTAGRADPRIAFVGHLLAAECGIAAASVALVSQLPERSLLARVAESYLRPLLSPEPLGFEAEFVNQRERTIHFRGILLPFAGPSERFDHLFGVISWKEAAEDALVEELLLELSQVVGTGPAGRAPPESVPHPPGAGPAPEG